MIKLQSYPNLNNKWKIKLNFNKRKEWLNKQSNELIKKL